MGLAGAVGDNAESFSFFFLKPAESFSLLAVFFSPRILLIDCARKSKRGIKMRIIVLALSCKI